MVSGEFSHKNAHRDDPTQSYDRGQIILIGAIALAFIILGIVVVFNGVLYTETISSSSTSQSAADVEVTQHELETGVAGIVHRSNIAGKDLDDDNLDIGEYNNLFRKVTTNNTPTITTVEYDGRNTPATSSVGNVSDFDGLTDSNISDASRDTSQVGHFTLRLNTSNDGTLVINNSTSETTFEVDGSQINVDGESVSTGTARVDLVAGTVNGTPHQRVPELFDPSESYEDITIDLNGVDGTYELVTNRSGGHDDALSTRTTEGAWKVDTRVIYESNSVTFQQTYDVPIYGGDA